MRANNYLTKNKEVFEMKIKAKILKEAKKKKFDVLRIYENGVVWGYRYIPRSNLYSHQPGWWDEKKGRFVFDYNSLLDAEDCNVARELIVDRWNVEELDDEEYV